MENEDNIPAYIASQPVMHSTTAPSASHPFAPLCTKNMIA